MNSFSTAFLVFGCDLGFEVPSLLCPDGQVVWQELTARPQTTQAERFSSVSHRDDQ